MSDRLAELRTEYMRAGLHEADVSPDPIVQIDRWMTDAIDAGVPEANAATLATATPDGVPNARIVLLKGHDERGLVFFTSYESPKGRELAANPRAAIVVLWKELERQLRVMGDVTKIDRAESEAYFHSRPRGSQLGAWASRQSTVIASRHALDVRLAELGEKYPGEVPLPPFWGGYRLAPNAVELWQGRPNRLHDRLHYARNASGNSWVITRLSP